jgi:hypothetical protein
VSPREESSADARNAALLGPDAVAAIEKIVAESVRAMPLDSGPLHHELRILLRNPRPVAPSSLSGDAA